MKIIRLPGHVLTALIALWLLSGCKQSGSHLAEDQDTVAAVAPAANMLTEQEKSEGWQLLFDGTTLEGWKRYNADSIGPLWIVRDNMIVCNGEGLTEGTASIGGSLITTRPFGNFELSLEWRLSPHGNSGILYHIVEGPRYPHAYDTGPEYQLLDDAAYAGENLKEAQMAGSNYDMFPAAPTKKLMPTGEWNTARLIYNNGHVEQWLNEEKVVEFDEGSADYNDRYKKSKWKEYPGWNKSKTGAIGLQDHGANVYFRNIKVREL